MSHNYSKHFNKNNNENNRVGYKQDGSHDHVVDLNQNELPSHNHGNVTPVENNEVENVIHYNDGVVSGCEKLYVREKGTKESKDLCIITKGSEVKVDLTDTSSEEFYKVVTPTGVEGYCMKKFITIK